MRISCGTASEFLFHRNLHQILSRETNAMFCSASSLTVTFSLQNRLLVLLGFTHKMALNSKSTPTSQNFLKNHQSFLEKKKGKSFKDLLVRANLKMILYMHSQRKGISVTCHSLHFLSGECKMNSWTSNLRGQN